MNLFGAKTEYDMSLLGIECDMILFGSFWGFDRIRHDSVWAQTEHEMTLFGAQTKCDMTVLGANAQTEYNMNLFWTQTEWSD